MFWLDTQFVQFLDEIPKHLDRSPDELPNLLTKYGLASNRYDLMILTSPTTGQMPSIHQIKLDTSTKCQTSAALLAASKDPALPKLTCLSIADASAICTKNPVANMVDKKT